MKESCAPLVCGTVWAYGNMAQTLCNQNSTVKYLRWAKKMAIGLLKCMATVAGLCESGLYIVRKEGVYHCTTGYAFHKLQLRIYCIA